MLVKSTPGWEPLTSVMKQCLSLILCVYLKRWQQCCMHFIGEWLQHEKDNEKFGLGFQLSTKSCWLILTASFAEDEKFNGKWWFHFSLQLFFSKLCFVFSFERSFKQNWIFISLISIKKEKKTSILTTSKK